MTYKVKIKEKIHSKPDIIIGKNGITEGLINEIKHQLKKKKVIKIKALRNISPDKDTFKNMLHEIIEKTKGKIVDQRGRTAIIIREKNGAPGGI